MFNVTRLIGSNPFSNFYKNQLKAEKDGERGQNSELLSIVKGNLEMIAVKDIEDIDFKNDGKIAIADQDGKVMSTNDKINNLKIFTKFTKKLYKTHSVAESEAEQVLQTLNSAKTHLNDFKNKSNDENIVRSLEESIKKLDSAYDQVFINKQRAPIEVKEDADVLIKAKALIQNNLIEHQKQADELQKQNKQSQKEKILKKAITISSGMTLGAPFYHLFLG